ncbi:MAG TPA: OmpW family outer membrane protein [Janthinobacterium sp.]|jgi:outer membrane protein|nr:OmpW family outer membrane protein [Janthinobacterium sp.]
MNIRLNSAVKMLALVAAMGMASSASAQSVGQWFGVVGVNKIMPKVESGEVSAPALPNSTAGVGNDTQPIFNIGYMITDHISAQLDLGLPYTNEFYGTGALQGSGKIGTAEVLPPTAFAQYRFFEPNAVIRPYVGAGITYAYFRKETGSGQLSALLNTGGPDTSFHLDNRWGASVQLGTTVAINQRWFADIGIIKTWLKTQATYSTGQTQDIKLDPVSVNVGIGYRF